MLTLAIDTATQVCTVALCQGQELLAEYTINMGMTHSEGLLPQLEQLLQRTGVEKKEIELVAVSMGPGSFTGLRIGLATAEAMAYAWGCCLHGVDTLKALIFIKPYTNGGKVSWWSWLLWRLSILSRPWSVSLCRAVLPCSWVSANA